MKRLVVRLDYCIGCRACEAACQSRFNYEARIRHAEVDATTLIPQPCRHCEEPLCAAACPFEVIQRVPESGVVRKSDFHCVGCRSCSLACPFGVIPSTLLRDMSQKCDLCSDRPDGPRCAATCPTGALQFVEKAVITGEHQTGARHLARSTHWRRV